MKILVTGNKGYIGSALCKRLLAEGFEVVGLDTGFYNNCNFLDIDYPLTQINKDIRRVVSSDLGGFDAIVHLAALSNDPIGEINPQLTRSINCSASINLAKIAKINKVKRFIFSSSCSIYGLSDKEFVDEQSNLNPLTEYAKSKIEAEKGISELADKDFSPVFLRNATVYGVSPMLRLDLVVNNLAGWAYTTGKIKIMSDGTPWRPIIHIEDICGAFIAALKAPRELIHNQVFNVGKDDGNYQVKDIAKMVKEIIPSCQIEYTGEHGADSRSYKVNFTKINMVLKDYFTPTYNIKNGIKELLKYFNENKLNQDEFHKSKYIRLKKIKELMDSRAINESLFWNNKGG